MNAWGFTDKGLIRTQNQDAFFLDVLHMDNQAICVVCDGMGGARAGNIASEMAVAHFVEEMRRGIKPHIGQKALCGLLERAAQRANSAVFEKSLTEAKFFGMGTTLVGLALNGYYAAIANVGDSRAYHISGEHIEQITRDHSVISDMLDRGDLTPEQARAHPNKNLITRALGTEADVVCDIFEPELQAGDFLLLCSDGLTNTMEDKEILFEIKHGGDPSQCCRRLAAAANARGGPDNITVILVSV